MVAGVCRWKDKNGAKTCDFPPYDLIRSLPQEVQRAFSRKALQHSDEYYRAFVEELLKKLQAGTPPPPPQPQPPVPAPQPQPVPSAVPMGGGNNADSLPPGMVEAAATAPPAVAAATFVSSSELQAEIGLLRRELTADLQQFGRQVQGQVQAVHQVVSGMALEVHSAVAALGRSVGAEVQAVRQEVSAQLSVLPQLRLELGGAVQGVGQQLQERLPAGGVLSAVSRQVEGLGAEVAGMKAAVGTLLEGLQSMQGAYLRLSRQNEGLLAGLAAASHQAGSSTTTGQAMLSLLNEEGRTPESATHRSQPRSGLGHDAPTYSDTGSTSINSSPMANGSTSASQHQQGGGRMVLPVIHISRASGLPAVNVLARADTAAAAGASSGASSSSRAFLQKGGGQTAAAANGMRQHRR